jgi:hypothetical protein
MEQALHHEEKKKKGIFFVLKHSAKTGTDIQR